MPECRSISRAVSRTAVGTVSGYVPLGSVCGTVVSEAVCANTFAGSSTRATTTLTSSKADSGVTGWAGCYRCGTGAMSPANRVAKFPLTVSSVRAPTCYAPVLRSLVD